ncbi:sulfotransferase family protein [Fulvivirga lutimaris]|uniref:sulfotransferase family protein n=1 Tax=Fulvivirga lutimaris TaxID=1819566 RepID=UPI0012BCCD8C|nr:sulfotransferase [Fulvivirga lutimaris]MTI38280.1 sulfotransferase [Fulvivirga lutimaris]
MGFRSKAGKIYRYIFNKELYINFIPSLFRINKLKKEPIIICGAPRSGTTLLKSILNSHLEISIIPNETMLFLRNKSNRKGRSGIYIYFLKFQLKLLLLAMPIKKTANRWGEKTPLNVMNIEFINSIFKGKVKFIHIVRDGRDVVLSSHNRMGRFMTAEKWVKYVKAGLEVKGMDNVLTITYEDLVSHFDQTTAQIQSFLGLESPFSEDQYYRYLPSINRGRSIMDSKVPKNTKGNLLGKLNKNRIKKWKNHPEDPEVIEFMKNEEAMEILKSLYN